MHTTLHAVHPHTYHVGVNPLYVLIEPLHQRGFLHFLPLHQSQDVIVLLQPPPLRADLRMATPVSCWSFAMQSRANMGCQEAAESLMAYQPGKATSKGELTGHPWASRA